MACKLNGLFSIGDDFDEDLLGTDWDSPTVCLPASVTAAVTSSSLRESSAPHGGQKGIPLQQTGETSTILHNATASHSSTQDVIAQTVTPCLRQLSTVQQQFPASSHNSPQHPIQGHSHIHINTNGPQKTALPQDDFDDWDLDLADLDESDPQMGVGTHIPQSVQTSVPPLEPPMATTVSSAKKLRPSNCGRTPNVPSGGLRKHNTPSNQSSSCNIPHTTSSTLPFTSPGQSPSVFSGPTPRPVNRGPCQSPRLWETPGRSQQGRSMFEPMSPAPSALSSPGLAPRPHHTPVLTNHLVRLVSAANRIPKRRPHSDPNRPKTRRFPGPAGLLPQQSLGQSLDDIVVSVPQTPAHGAVARLPSQGPSSQTEEEEFTGGPWAMMKAEMGLDERNPSCFLHSYSVVKVLRKAALKQLPKNKVPNMAVILKSILPTHADAKVVFKDPTGEIQGTVHRHLLEDRLGELKAGAVLLLKQVGVFSPSHRNHYLNVTPNNLLRLYPPDGVCLSSAQLSPPALEPVLLSPIRYPSVPGDPVSRMQLVFDEENEEAGQGPRVPAGSRDESSEAHLGRVDNTALQDPAWGADDDLDELLGELPEENLLL